MKTAFSILLLAFLACGCGKPALAPSKPDLSGEWDLHIGISIASLRLKDEAGVLSGRVKFTSEFGGLRTEIHGLRTANKIEFQYTDEATNFLSYKGDIENEKLSGMCSIAGPVTGPDVVWIATRSK